MLKIQEVKRRLKNKEFILLSEYTGVMDKHHVECFCGKIFNPRIKDIFDNKTNSCGCNRKYSEDDIKTLLKKNNFELYNTYENYKDVNSRITLKCFCGNVFTTTLHNIIHNYVRSCGCLKKGDKAYQWNGYGEISGSYLTSLKRGAKERNLNFDITIKYMWDLFLLQNKKCKLSNRELTFTDSFRLNRKNQTASLDRIDNNKGYIVGNVQWIHKDINKMRMNFEINHFLSWIEEIYKHNFKEKR